MIQPQMGDILDYASELGIEMKEGQEYNLDFDDKGTAHVMVREDGALKKDVSFKEGQFVKAPDFSDEVKGEIDMLGETSRVMRHAMIIIGAVVVLSCVLAVAMVCYMR